jgi:chorismate mutase
MASLKNFRLQLDALDQEIVSLLNRRMHIADSIADWKKNNNLSIEDCERENEIFTHVHSESSHYVLREMIGEIYELIMKCSKISQTLNQSSQCPFSKIGIIGLGLIGGSILKTIKAKNSKIMISSLIYDSPDYIQARSSGLVDHWYEEVEMLCADLELIILAVPPEALNGYAEAISVVSTHRIDRPLIICDVVGAKDNVLPIFEVFTTNSLECVATCPRREKELFGFTHSSGILFVSTPWMITPHRKNQKNTLSRMAEFITYLGGNPAFLPEEKYFL